MAGQIAISGNMVSYHYAGTEPSFWDIVERVKDSVKDFFIGIRDFFLHHLWYRFFPLSEDSIQVITRSELSLLKEVVVAPGVTDADCEIQYDLLPEAVRDIVKQQYITALDRRDWAHGSLEKTSDFVRDWFLDQNRFSLFVRTLDRQIASI